MAKYSKSVVFNNAMIDMNEMELVEHSKDGDVIATYSLRDVLSAWDGEYGISITIKKQGELNELSDDGGEEE